MKLIAMDSSGLTASVAIVEDERVVAEYSVNHKKTHSQTLLPMLDEISKMAELELDTVDAIAIAKGPGSFTGLRIGSATAKGLGLTLDIPIVEVTTTEGLAFNMYGSSDLICPLMDARRNQVYTGLYEFVGSDEDYHMETILDASALPIEQIIEKVNSLNRRVVFLGDGVAVYKESIEKLTTVDFLYAPIHKNLQSAASVGALGMRYFKQGKAVSADEHVPEYLRLSQAERERNEKESL